MFPHLALSQSGYHVTRAHLSGFGTAMAERLIVDKYLRPTTTLADCPHLHIPPPSTLQDGGFVRDSLISVTTVHFTLSHILKPPTPSPPWLVHSPPRHHILIHIHPTHATLLRTTTLIFTPWTTSQILELHRVATLVVRPYQGHTRSQSTLIPLYSPMVLAHLGHRPCRTIRTRFPLASTMLYDRPTPRIQPQGLRILPSITTRLRHREQVQTRSGHNIQSPTPDHIPERTYTTIGKARSLPQITLHSFIRSRKNAKVVRHLPSDQQPSIHPHPHPSRREPLRTLSLPYILYTKDFPVLNQVSSQSL